MKHLALFLVALLAVTPLSAETRTYTVLDPPTVSDFTKSRCSPLALADAIDRSAISVSLGSVTTSVVHLNPETVSIYFTSALTAGDLDVLEGTGHCLPPPCGGLIGGHESVGSIVDEAMATVPEEISTTATDYQDIVASTTDTLTGSIRHKCYIQYKTDSGTEIKMRMIADSEETMSRTSDTGGEWHRGSCVDYYSVDSEITTFTIQYKRASGEGTVYTSAIWMEWELVR